MKILLVSVVLLALIVSPVLSEENNMHPVQKPLVLSNGEPMVAIYYFTHWWEPWKSSDEAIYDDFVKMRKMGVNTLLLDSEASQAMDGDFRLLDRGHEQAMRTGMTILPWLSLKTWSDMTSEGRRAWSMERYGAAVDVTENGFLPYGPGTIDFGVAYAKDYLSRYKDQALLHVMKDGRECPVIALTVEASWKTAQSLDPETRMHFCRWLRIKYGSLEDLNRAWGTKFEDLLEIDPADQKIFDYDAAGDREKRDISKPVRDHISFRAQIVSDALAAMRARLRKEYPNLLIAAEIPYQLATDHPHAWGYTVNCASILEMVEYADIVMVRTTGRLSDRSRQAAADFIKETGKSFIFLHRIAPQQGPGDSKMKKGDTVELFATEAAAFASGIGYYSWNEMGDVHMFTNSLTNVSATICEVDEKQFDDMCSRVDGINKAFWKIHRKGLKEIQVPAAIPDGGLPVIY